MLPSVTIIVQAVQNNNAINTTAIKTNKNKDKSSNELGVCLSCMHS